MTQKIQKLLSKYLVLLVTGGLVYVLIELLARGYTHWTMFVLGGVCFICLGLLNEIVPWSMNIISQMIIGMTLITLLELITGCIVNLWLGWNVWDYSDRPYNLLGQICLKNSCYWFWLSAVGIILDDYLRYWIFKEDKPKYYLL